MTHYNIRTLALSCACAAVALLCGISAGVPARGADTAPSSLSAYRNKNRVLLVFAPSAEDSRYRRQDALFRGKDSGLTERDLVRINVFGKSSSTLRRRYGVGTDDFRVILVGKDGHAAYSSTRPVVTSDLFRRIDRMPMRRDEMRRRGR